MTNSLIDPRVLLQFDFGQLHPFKIYRLGLTYALMEVYSLVHTEQVRILEPRAATEAEMLPFHTAEYLNTLRLADRDTIDLNLFAHGLGGGDNPVFPGVYEWGALVAGASIDCAQEVLTGRAKIAFNIAGGLHHAMPSRASGFCHINDAALAIHSIIAQGKRVVYLDIDAHHGDGVQHAFYSTDRVLTISVHQDGRTIFPGSGASSEIGQREGRGYAVNIPLAPGACDDAFERICDEIVFPAINRYAPDILVTQLGADALWGDRVADLGMSLTQFERMITRLRRLDLPWLALGGGGYAIENVVRAWTLAWAQMNGIDLPDAIPPEWPTQIKTYRMNADGLRLASLRLTSLRLTSLRGEESSARSPQYVFDALNSTIDSLQQTVLPLIAEREKTS